MAGGTKATALMVSGLLLASLPGQGGKGPVGAAEKAIRKKAIRYIRLMELPSMRVEAAAELTKLGKKAVPSLVRALDDPRPEVVSRLALVLRMLGDDAKPAIPTLRRIAKGKDEKLA